MSKIVSKPFTLLASRLIWGAFSAVLLWLVLFLATAEQFAVVRWLSYVTPWMAGGLLLLALAAFLLRKWMQGIVTVVLGLLLLLPYMPRFLPSDLAAMDVHASHQQVYKVMTYSKMGRNHDVEAMARTIAAQKPDLLFMQELSGEDADKLKVMLDEAAGVPLNIDVCEHIGAVISRFPLHSLKGKGDLEQAVQIDFPEIPVLAWNVHLQKSLLDTQVQYKGVDWLADKISHEQEPLLVAGDFNATMINFPYVKIRQQLDNAFERAGFGFGFTFPSPARRMGVVTPFMRIDHIFFSRHFRVHDARVVKDAGGSDHYPVIALLSLTPGLR